MAALLQSAATSMGQPQQYQQDGDGGGGMIIPPGTPLPSWLTAGLTAAAAFQVGALSSDIPTDELRAAGSKLFQDGRTYLQAFRLLRAM